MLKGIVCQNGGHFFTWFRESLWKELTWIKFDDGEIKKQSCWGAVVEECLSLSAVPTLIFYEEIPEFYKHDKELERSFNISRSINLKMLKDAWEREYGSIGDPYDFEVNLS